MTLTATSFARRVESEFCGTRVIFPGDPVLPILPRARMSLRAFFSPATCRSSIRISIRPDGRGGSSYDNAGPQLRVHGPRLINSSLLIRLVLSLALKGGRDGTATVSRTERAINVAGRAYLLRPPNMRHFSGTSWRPRAGRRGGI